ncbi:hypothetical protein PLAN_41029 [Planktothrix rubescens CCAP 1459/22]|uniref:Uncharacterized protein n=1 Tax=Planktothrix rubescens CCAP 1459/22 TaxID=329571 RepID=A0A6J7ZQA2_PLARU|nr:hypothetical protein PLAN_41029 [Planktothrix rubescens NIVA-CYA 18]CAD0217904.1 hypothetical protein PL10110_1010054 [Planktothrix agardhii]
MGGKPFNGASRDLSVSHARLQGLPSVDLGQWCFLTSGAKIIIRIENKEKQCQQFIG